ncbi:ankyrin repeat domain-containing protein 26 isoform X2 [Austrofundulus limnaeus]|nr:PREDICTED: ankyrin repeat domain-containing protein 26-like isoform X2 [Austrofundulus limnaeus]
MKAVQGQHERCVSILLENHAEPNLVDINGNTALHLAANIPSISTAILLLQHGAEINTQNKEGFTPLTVAVREDHIDMAEFLLKEFADVNSVDQDQRSPLMLAAGNEQINMVKLLLQFNADVTLKDTKGWSADDYAVMNGHHLCSHLIIEHSTQKMDRTSISLQGPSKKKKMLGSPSHDVEAGFSLGGPATDKDDLEENSQSESVSRVSKGAADEWPSSEDEDESISNEKKPLKVNLGKVFGSRKEEASALSDTSSSGTESEPENESRVQRIPSIPKASTSSISLQHPVDSPAVSSFPKCLQMSSTPLSNHRKKEDSTEDEDDGEDEHEEEEGDMSDENDQSEVSEESPEATSPVPEAEPVKEKKRDFLSELGLEGGEEKPESWDSESNSEKSIMPHKEDQDFDTQNQQEMLSTEAPLQEHMFYIPSFLRGRGGSRMAERDRPQCSQREAGNNSKSENGGEPVEKDETPQKENEKTKRERLAVLSKLEETADQKSDLMVELDVGDADDLEDASDWDSASTTSKRTLPGRRMASPGLQEFSENTNMPGNEEEVADVTAAPSTPQRSSSSEKKLPSTPTESAPQPQPRIRNMMLQKPDSDKDVVSFVCCPLESGSETNKAASPYRTSPDDNQHQNVADPQAVVEAGSPEHSLMAKDINNSLEFIEKQQKEEDHVVDRHKLDLFHSGSEEKNADFRSQCCPEDTRGEDAPWEKRYEKLWVEVEKKEIKSTFKNVAGELKEKFGELYKSRQETENTIEEATPALTSAEEDSSDEEEGGEVIVQPAARARSTVLLTIPEQSESGQEDSAAESPDDSVCEERTHMSSDHHDPEPLNSDVLRSVPPQLNEAHKERVKSIHDTKTLFHGNGTPMDSFLKDETEPDVGPVFIDRPGDQNETDMSNVGLREELEGFPLSQLSLQSRRSDVFEELEENRKRFKLEDSRETANTAMRDQKSSFSMDGGKTAVEDVGSKKAETGSGYLLNQPAGIHQEEQPVAAQSTNRAPEQLHLPLHQSCNNKKQEKLVVRGARQGAPQTSTHVNGEPLAVFDDSSLSDVSNDEERLSTSALQKNKNPEEMDLAEDFDELTQSSDTATDDTDSPTSGYRHASLLIQKLDSATLDTTNIAKLQNIFHEYERAIRKERSHRGYLADKVKQLEVERAELKNSLEEVKDAKSLLEHNQLELQTEITNLKFQLKQEQENRHNATMMYNTTRDKLRRTEEQQQLEVQERQKVELALRNLELEMRTLICKIKQLEEDNGETQRLLAQERSTRILQENLLSNHLRKQQEIEVENKRNMSKSNEALSQLTEASEREKELLHQTAALQEQLTMLRADHERLQANNSMKEGHLTEENEALKEKLEDLQRDLKFSEESVTQTAFSCNKQLSTLKSELAITTSRLESERQSREALETELESTRNRLDRAVKEAELRLTAHSDTERALLREKEEHQRLKDRLTAEVANQREAVSNLSQKLAKAEARANSMENEVHRATLQLTEKGLLLDVLHREKDQAATRAKEMEIALQAERDSVSRAGARQEASQERLAQAQSEAMLLRQQLEEAQNKGVAKERAVTDAQERFSDILSKLRSDCEERVQLIEERNKELSSKAADLRDQIYKLEEEKNERETSLRQLQQELADSLKKLSMSEASLEVNTRYRNDLEEEKTRLLKDLDRVKGKLEESEDQYVEAERHVNSLKSSLDEREKELNAAAQKLQEALSASAASEITIKQLEETVQKLEIENARLEATAKQQSNKIDSLQKGAQEAAMLTGCSSGGGVRGHLEELVTNLQSSKMTLEDQLNREVQKQSVLSHTAQDSQALWEEELKSRSKLGLRLAELEKEKGELTAQMEIEKKKAKKLTEQKKAVDARLDQEMNRNTELQKEMYRLRTLLKTAKKKVQDQKAGGAEFASPMSSLQMDMGRQRHLQVVDDLQEQLEKETYRRSQLEKTIEELKVQIASLKSFSYSSDHVERKRQLEEEVLDLRRRLETAQVEQSQMEQYRREAEEKARQEIQLKLEQVNLFLQSQAASQEALDQIKAANEASLRSQLEQRIRELEGELSRARSTQQDSVNQKDATRTELERYRQLYSEETRLRKSLTAKLERANIRLSEANSKLLSERSRSFITSNITNGSLVGPSLDLSSLGSPANYGATLGSQNRSFGLGFPLLSPTTEGQNSRVEDYLAKMQRELDRNISKELSSATAELDAASMRLSPGGSASRVELDPASRAAQQYLEVLKKNNRI